MTPGVVDEEALRRRADAYRRSPPLTEAEEAAWRAAYHARYGTPAQQAAAYETEKRRRDRVILYVFLVCAVGAVIAGLNHTVVERLLDRVPDLHLSRLAEAGLLFGATAVVIAGIGWAVTRRP